MKIRNKTTQERLDIKKQELALETNRMVRVILKANIKVLESNLKLETKGDK
jgi:hypothetical protein